MDISAPVWNVTQAAYSFELLHQVPRCLSAPFAYEKEENSGIPEPLPDALELFSKSLLDILLEKSKKWFSAPLRKESVLKRLRHEFSHASQEKPVENGWYSVSWVPERFEVRSKEFIFYWKVEQYEKAAPIIPESFLTATTPRARSPVGEPETKTIQIQNTVESTLPEGLIPVQDLPLSDLPPLPFYVDDETQRDKREDDKRKIREARLRVALAKLKAERMAEHYYQRYGEKADDSDSELSSDSDSVVSFAAQDYP
jgi:hypothetical protein